MKRMLAHKSISPQSPSTDQRELQEKIIEMINFLSDILEGQDQDSDVLKGLDANTMERVIMGLIPIFRVSSTKYLIGSQIKSVMVRSDRLLVSVGGGAITIEEHWRTAAVSEMLKINKQLASSTTRTSTLTQYVTSVMSKDNTIQKK